MNNTSREKFRYLVERYGSKSFRLGLTPDDEGRKQQHREAFDELMALAELFPEHAESASRDADCSPPTECWGDVPPLIDARPAEYEEVTYGISRAIQGNEVIIDCGDGDITLVKLTFEERDAAWAAYCKGLRIAVKVVEHPAHSLLSENAPNPPTPKTP